MLNLDPSKFLHPATYVAAVISEWKVLRQLKGKIAPYSIPLKDKAQFLGAVQTMQKTAQFLSMPTADRIISNGFQQASERIAIDGPISEYDLALLIGYAETALTVFCTEAETRAFIALAPGHAQFLQPTHPLFGVEVDDAFPNASAEITDAGRCRAAGLWTACVMHLMRAAEDPLNALAAWVGVEVGQNWNTALNQIDSQLRSRNKSTAGEAEEQWASEASAHLRAIKNAWRNYAAHGHVRYNEAEAVAIWNNVQSLMQTLARKLG
jgi:hypothetical protein